MTSWEHVYHLTWTLRNTSTTSPGHLGTRLPPHLATWGHVYYLTWPLWKMSTYSPGRRYILSVSSLVLCPKHRPIPIFAALKWSKWSKIKGSGQIIMCLLLVNKSNRETFTTMANPESLVALSLWTLTRTIGPSELYNNRLTWSGLWYEL